MGTPSGAATCSTVGIEAGRWAFATSWNGSPGPRQDLAVILPPRRVEQSQRGLVEEPRGEPARPGRPLAPREGARLEGDRGLADRLSGVRIELADPDHRVIDPDQLARDVPLQHAELPLVGVLEAVPRAGQEDEEAGMRDDEARLPLLPGEPDQRRAEDVGPQEGQQEGEPRAHVDPFLHRGGPVPRLEERGVRQDGRQGRQADDRQLQRRQEAVHRVDRAEGAVRRRARRGGRPVGRRRFDHGRRHDDAPNGEGELEGRIGGGGGRTDRRRTLRPIVVESARRGQ